MSSNPYFDLRDAKIGNLANEVHGDQKSIQNNYELRSKQNLVEAAADIQKLLVQLERTYPTETENEKQIVVNEAVKRIKQSPTLQARVTGALKSGGIEALKELVDHPLVGILIAALEGWQKTE